MNRLRPLLLSILALVITAATLGVAIGPTSASTALSTTRPTPTVWLCRPGQAADPCTPGLTITRVALPATTLGVTHARVAAKPKIDCFYVYPTVSDQKTPNADLAVDPQERSIALYQAAMFSRDCRVYAPMYRQLTLATIGGQVTAAESTLAYGDVLHAWENYLHRYNRGRGVVLIGHSQGAFILRKLVADQIDPHPAMRRLLVSAVLLGGNVTVKRGSDTGGDFHHIRACHSATQVGCVIAYSAFDATPPADSVFGRTTSPGLQVLCTNPAALAGGTGALDPILPTQPFAPHSTIAAGIDLLGFTLPPVTTPWVSAPGSYTAHCSTAGGADVLSVTAVGRAPVLHYSPLPTWGLHLVDDNIALGNLVGIVASEAAAYRPSR